MPRRVSSHPAVPHGFVPPRHTAYRRLLQLKSRFQRKLSAFRETLVKIGRSSPKTRVG